MLFGKKKNETVEERGIGSAIELGERIEIFDSYGRKASMLKTDWAEKLLPARLKECWDNADRLYAEIIFNVDNNMAYEVTEAAEHLAELEPGKERAAIVLSIVYRKQERFESAKTVLEDFIQEHGRSGALLVNLARVYEAQDDIKKAQNTLWEGLALDPNQDNGLSWWLFTQREDGDKEKYLRALKAAGQLPGAYLPQLYQARFYLEENQVRDALNIYKEVLAADADKRQVLPMISGDLGKFRLLKAMVTLIAPVYDLDEHDARTGLNLVQAYLGLGELEEGEKLLGRLFRLERADLKQPLLEISARFDKEKRQKIVEQQQTDDKKVEILGIEKPIFYFGMKEGTFPEVDKTGKKKIGILSYTNKQESVVERRAEAENEASRLTKSVPLFISEALYFYSDFSPIVYIPVINQIGAVLPGTEWDQAFLERMVKQHDLAMLITGDIQVTKDNRGYAIHTKIVHADGSTHKDETVLTKGEDIMSLLSRMYLHATGSALHDAAELSGFYQLPKVELSMQYLTALAQSLTQTMVQMRTVPFSHLWGERNIINWFMNIALADRKYFMMKLLFLQSLIRSRAYGSDVYLEYTNVAKKILADTEKQAAEMGETAQHIVDALESMLVIE